ncbi:MAG TPA: response regulator transcription factor, partial [Anaerolineales bacterium]|nr:response regulator transcription factor [Anaerolineales bacterium]
AQRMNAGARLARASLGFAGGVVTPGIADQRVIFLLTEALAVLGPADSALKARLLSRLAMEYRYSPFQEKREDLSREAVEIARRLGDHATLVFAMNARHYAILGPDTLEQRMALSIELAQLAEQTGDWELTLQSLPWRLADLLDLGHVRAVDEAIESSARLADALRQPIYLWYIHTFQALRALMKGQFMEGERLAVAAHTLGQRVQPGAADVYYAAQMFVLRREQRRLGEMEKPLQNVLEQYPAMPVLQAMLTLVYWQTERIAETQAELTRLCANRAEALPWDQLWLGAVAILAEVATLLADRASAITLYELLLPYAQRNIVVGVPICLGAAATYLGCLATTLKDWSVAVQHFEEALIINARLGTPPFLARTQYYYSAMLLARKQGADREKAFQLLEQAHDMAQELGMSHLMEQIQRLLVGEPLREPSLPTPHGLTAREAQVLQLIAAGRSTKEIAAALFISNPTVERHITHIYQKIGARSRAEATAFALRHGLG